MSSVEEIQIVKRRIKRSERALAEARAERLHARLCGYESTERHWQRQEWLNEKHLKGWHGAFKLLTGEDYDAG